jgi:(R,R)-butanediol dehydrogenase/meso-butanediol dehydrogenase/diacetyl reductase
MKAAYYEGNKTCTVGESQPKAPAPGQVKLKVAYAGICGTDNHIYLGHMDNRLKLPQVIGHEMSGEIVEIGEGVKGFKAGDKVVVRPLDPCRNCPTTSALISTSSALTHRGRFRVGGRFPLTPCITCQTRWI